MRPQQDRSGPTEERRWESHGRWQIQRLRDNADCADQEFEAIADDANPGLQALLSFELNGTPK